VSRTDYTDRYGSSRGPLAALLLLLSVLVMLWVASVVILSGGVFTRGI
jgi:hypothetical protein